MRGVHIILLLIFYHCIAFTQNVMRNVLWQDNALVNTNIVLSFEGAQYKDTNNFPYFTETITNVSGKDVTYKLSDYKTDIISSDSLTTISNLGNLPSDFSFIYTKQSFSTYSITLLPLRKNATTGAIEKITQFTLSENILPSNQNWASNSVLRSGKWVKIKIIQDGVYKLTYAELLKLGIDNPGNIRIYGNEAGMLPRDNAVIRPNDVQEIPISYIEQQSGNFKEGDYVAFYAEGPTSWNYNTGAQMFLHKLHEFSDCSYYYITSDLGRGKTNQTTLSLSTTANKTVSSFDDFSYTENETTNRCQTGSRWFGKEVFGSQTSYSFNYNFPTLVTGTIKTQVSLAWQSTSGSAMNYSLNGSTASLSLSTATPKESDNCDNKIITDRRTFPCSSDNILLTLSYDKQGSSSAMALLDAIDVNVRRSLSMSGSQMIFRDNASVGSGNISLFNLTNASLNINVWEVSKIDQTSVIQGNLLGNTFSYTLSTDALRKFIAFDKTNLLTPITTGSDLGIIANQDLHGMTIPNLLIVYHPDFTLQAQRLAKHRTSQGLKVALVTPQQIYNEFSMGSSDVQAIRDFARMLRDKDPNTFKYMLLFGDGSFDNRPGVVPGNTNFIITYESDSYGATDHTVPVCDDFFGLLDSKETADSGFLDIGIGRLPVFDTNQANAIVNKLIHYDSPETFGSWRNNVCFVADDKEDNIFTFLRDADYTAEKALTEYPSINVTKIYLDAYKQYINSSGQTCPDASRAITNIVHRGTTVLDFTGHGGQDGITNENLFNKTVIDTWHNKDRMFLLFTGSCKVTRFDYLQLNDKGYSRYVTAGEYAVLKEDAGAICSVSTNRDTYADGNTRLNNGLMDYISNKNNEPLYRLGDIYLRAKNTASKGSNTLDQNTRNFILMGDPSMQFAIPPQNKIITDSINGTTPDKDTISALKEVTIKGHIANAEGALENINGFLSMTLFDKSQEWETIDNHGYGVESFNTQEQAVIKGNASVKNGYFSFRFIVPKDINYNIGNGKISYYFHNDEHNMSGYNNSIKVGGLSNSSLIDKTGPKIRLYMNDTTFKNGGITNNSPELLVILNDPCGINATGASIGHDITAILDNDDDQTFNLNDYFETDLNNFQQGRIRYPFSNLTVGKHTLKLIAWDGMNNSNEAEIEFHVTSGKQLIIQNVGCYPNPMSEYTNFVFDHNMPGEDIKITIQIYDLSGSMVQSLVTTDNSSAFSTNPITWYGDIYGGNVLGNGIYIFKIMAEVQKEGLSAVGSGKILIAR